MNKSNRLAFATTVFTAIMTVSLLTPKANALVGLLMGSPVGSTIGAVVGVLGGVGVASTAGLAGGAVPALGAIPILAGAVGVLGVVVLEDGTTADIRYTYLTDKQASKIGLEPTQATEFNSNVEIFNGIKDQIAMTVDSHTPQSEIVLKWQTALNDYHVSESAKIALVRVSEQIFKHTK
jgi:hypothetical protein